MLLTGKNADSFTDRLHIINFRNFLQGLGIDVCNSLKIIYCGF